MQSTFEELGGTYKQVGNYLLPNVEVPENQEVGFWGMRRKMYLLEYKPVLYTALLRWCCFFDSQIFVDISTNNKYNIEVDISTSIY